MLEQEQSFQVSLWLWWPLSQLVTHGPTSSILQTHENKVDRFFIFMLRVLLFQDGMVDGVMNLK